MADADGANPDIPSRGKMSDADLLQLIASYERAALGSSVAAGATISTTVFPSQQQMTTLEIDRYNAINMYFGRPLGNEVENRSQVVLPELRDTIEWIMPQLMRMFVGSKQICRFEPETPQDEQQAEMETAVVNHVFMKDNNGFFVLHDFFKDAMLMRNGYASIDYKEEEHTSVERYSGLTEVELTKLLADMADEDTKILEQREYTQDFPIMAPIPGAQPDPTLPIVKVPVWDIKIRRTESKGKIYVTCLPPEECMVSPTYPGKSLISPSSSCSRPRRRGPSSLPMGSIRTWSLPYRLDAPIGSKWMPWRAISWSTSYRSRILRIAPCRRLSCAR